MCARGVGARIAAARTHIMGLRAKLLRCAVPRSQNRASAPVPLEGSILVYSLNTPPHTHTHLRTRSTRYNRQTGFCPSLQAGAAQVEPAQVGVLHPTTVVPPPAFLSAFAAHRRPLEAKGRPFCQQFSPGIVVVGRSYSLGGLCAETDWCDVSRAWPARHPCQRRVEN